MANMTPTKFIAFLVASFVVQKLRKILAWAIISVATISAIVLVGFALGNAIGFFYVSLLKPLLSGSITFESVKPQLAAIGVLSIGALAICAIKWSFREVSDNGWIDRK